MNVRVQIDGKTYTVEIGDLNSRPIQAIVDGQVFAVWPEEVEGVAAAAVQAESARPPATPLMSTAPIKAANASNQANTVTAPLPGDVVVVAVKPGDVIDVGQLLCTVESMKMNNPIRSTQAGIVEQVLIVVGEHVNHGQPLLTLRQTNH